jgi:hypothetical protein
LNKVAVHIHNLREIRITTEHSWFQVRRITVALGVYFSNDAVGLLETAIENGRIPVMDAGCDAKT